MKKIYYRWWYRAFYILQSLVLLIPAIYMYKKIPNKTLISFSISVQIFLLILQIIIVFYTLYASKSYDNGYFFGLKQIKNYLYNKQNETYEKVKLTYDGALKYVRHPYYFAGIIIIWIRPLNTKDLLLNIIFTIYFVLGAINEERKLLRQFGNEYKKYKEKVPMLIPAFWRMF